jgi:HEAT repeat protein
MKSPLILVSVMVAIFCLAPQTLSQSRVRIIAGNGNGTGSFAAGKSVSARVWDGDLFDKDGNHAKRIFIPIGLPKVKEELGSIWQDQTISRNVEKAIKELNALWLLVNQPQAMPAEMRFEALAAVAEARGRAYLMNQDYANAWIAVTLMGLGPEPILLDGMTPNLVKYSSDDARVMKKALEVKRLKHFRDEVGKAASDHFSLVADLGIETAGYEYLITNFGFPSGPTRTVVENHLRNGDMEAILQLGVRAVPSLATAVLSDLDGVVHSYSTDPLIALSKVDELAACQLMLKNFDQGGNEWKFRVLNAFERIPDQGTLMSEENRFGPNPHWPDLLARLCHIPTTRLRALSHINMKNREIVTNSSLVEGLARDFHQLSAEEAMAVLMAFPLQRDYRDIKDLLDTALQSEFEDIRQRAIWMYIGTQASKEAVLPLANDSSPKVRAAVADAYTISYNSSRRKHIEGNEETRRILLNLLMDPEHEVREHASRSLWRWNHVFPIAEPYLHSIPHLSLSSDATEVLNKTRTLQNEERSKIITGMAKSRKSEVLEGLDAFLFQGDLRKDFELVHNILLQRIQDTEFPFYSQQDRSNFTPDGRIESLLRKLSNQDQRQAAFAFTLAFESGFPQILRGYSNRYFEDSLNEMPVISTEYCLRTLESVDEKSYWALRTAVDNLMDRDEEIDDRIALVVASNDRPLLARLCALKLLIRRGVPQAEDSALAFLSELPPTAGSYIDYPIKEMYFHDPVRQGKFLDQVCTEPIISSPMGNWFLKHFDQTADPRRFISILLGAAYFENFGESSGLMREALMLIRSQGLEKQFIAEIIRSAKATSKHVYYYAFRCIESHRDPVFIPALGEISVGQGPRPRFGQEQSLMAVEVLEGYQSEQAAKELLRCLGSVNDETIRNRITAALNHIREYHEQKAYWESIETAAPNRDTAVNELLAMLRDPDPEIRAAALAGLAPLKAAEAIPRVIPLLKDEDKNVRAAAKKALAELQKIRVTSEGE